MWRYFLYENRVSIEIAETRELFSQNRLPKKPECSRVILLSSEECWSATLGRFPGSIVQVDLTIPLQKIFHQYYLRPNVGWTRTFRRVVMGVCDQWSTGTRTHARTYAKYKIWFSWERSFFFSFWRIETLFNRNFFFPLGDFFSFGALASNERLTA